MTVNNNDNTNTDTDNTDITYSNSININSNFSIKGIRDGRLHLMICKCKHTECIARYDAKFIALVDKKRVLRSELFGNTLNNPHGFASLVLFYPYRIGIIQMTNFKNMRLRNIRYIAITCNPPEKRIVERFKDFLEVNEIQCTKGLIDTTVKLNSITDCLKGYGSCYGNS